MKFTESELLSALREAAKRPETADGSTTKELAVKLGVSVDAVRKLIEKLSAEGAVRPVRVPRRAITGEMRGVWAYQLVGKVKTK